VAGPAGRARAMGTRGTPAPRPETLPPSLPPASTPSGPRATCLRPPVADLRSTGYSRRDARRVRVLREGAPAPHPLAAAVGAGRLTGTVPGQRARTGGTPRADPVPAPAHDARGRGAVATVPRPASDVADALRLRVPA